MKKAVVTGGHMTPAIAVAQELKNRGWYIIYIGRKYALEGDKTLSQESQIIPKLGYKFISISAGRLQRKFTSYTLASILKIPIGFLQALLCLVKIRPKAILSFGGYVALPVTLVGRILGIPIVTHEQTLYPGLANKIIGLIANKICISWNETKNDFSSKKLVYTGNPIRQEVFKINKKLPIKKGKPLLYITGGNLGSHSINMAIYEALSELLKNFIVVHQCGETEKYQDYNKLSALKATTIRPLGENYYLYKFIDQDYIGWVMQKADLVITRAGANIIAEIIALGKLSILIPLPWSGGEQEKNAKYLESRKAARILKQQDLIGGRLITEIKSTLADSQLIRGNLNKLKDTFFLNADKRVADVVESIS